MNRPPSPLSVSAHLRGEFKTAKVRVAREFNYGYEDIRTAIENRYLETGKAFPDSGSLIDSLYELSLAPPHAPMKRIIEEEEKRKLLLLHETIALYNRNKCRICLEREVGIVTLYTLLPFGYV